MQEFLSAESTGMLAIDGGTPIRRAAPPNWPVFDADEIASVVATLQSGKVNQWTGDRVQAFEREFAQSLDRPHAIAVTNGTVALETMLRAYDIGPGDEVIVTPRSFIASASCVNLVGGDAGFRRCRSRHRNDHAGHGAAVDRRREPRRSSSSIFMAGRPTCPASCEFARQHGLLVFEDCAQAQGARIEGKPVGAFGDASAFSFCQDKIMTTGGEGGMVVFADPGGWNRAWSYRDNGKDYDAMHSSGTTGRLSLGLYGLRHQCPHERNAGGDRLAPA